MCIYIYIIEVLLDCVLNNSPQNCWQPMKICKICMLSCPPRCCFHSREVRKSVMVFCWSWLVALDCCDRLMSGPLVMSLLVRWENALVGRLLAPANPLCWSRQMQRKKVQNEPSGLASHAKLQWVETHQGPNFQITLLGISRAWLLEKTWLSASD